MANATTSLIGKRNAPKAPARAAALAEPIRFYRVKEDRMVPRKGHGGTPYLLKKGQEISSANYPRKDLEAAGVEVVEIPTPSWFLEAQTTARELHQTKLDEGLDVGPLPPPYEPPALERATASAPAAEPTS